MKSNQQELPVGWERKKLGECARLINGRAYSQDELLEEGTPVVRIQNLNGGDRWYYSNLHLPEEKYCVDGDLLFAWSASFGPYIWRGPKSIFHYHIWRVLPYENLDRKFAFYLLGWITERVKAAARGVAMLHMTKAGMEDWEVLLPPVSEQRRIAAILDQADVLRAKRREALVLLDELQQGIFIEAFGDPVENPMDWPLVSFDMACPTRLGKMLDKKQNNGKSPRKYLRNANVQWFRFDLTDVLEMDFDRMARETFRLEIGDLLICEGGEPGRAAIWRDELNECYYQKALHRGRPNPDLATPEYLNWLLWFLAIRGGLADHVTSATIAHLTGEKLKAMRIPLPPLGLQVEFVRRIEEASKVKSSIEASLVEMDKLFSALQHRAFRGEL